MYKINDIVRLIKTNDRAVDRAMVAIYRRQTADEKRSSTTRHDNARGFSSADAGKGSYYARWVLNGNRLTGQHLRQARKMAIKYRRQLTEIANLGEKE